MREAKEINRSLHYLELVIVALAEKEKGKREHVPYRNSVITSVLRDSLGGNCKTTMIATLSTELEYLNESISTCGFAQRVACISNNARLNEEVDPYVLIARLRRQISQLEAELLLARGGEMDTSPLPAYELEKIREAVRDFIQDPAENASLTFADLRKFDASCRILKDMILEGRGSVHTGSVQATPLGPQSQPSTHPEQPRSEYDLEQANKRLRAQLYQRDIEVGVLIQRMKGQKTELRGLQKKDTLTFPFKPSQPPAHGRPVPPACDSLNSVKKEEDAQKALFDKFLAQYPPAAMIKEQEELLKNKTLEAKQISKKAFELKGAWGEF